MKRLFFTLLLGTSCFISFSQGMSNDTIHWIDYRKLTWNDFKGDAIDLPNLSGESLMIVLANFQKITWFLPAKTSVVTVFDRKNSWVNNNGKTDLALKYYQVMFDLYEVYTRRLKKEFKNTKFGFDPNKIFQQKYNSSLTDLSDRNKQYIKETKMGTDNDAVDKWDKIIQAELKELESYK